MKNKIFIRYICVFLILIILFATFLTLSSMFSSDKIYNNVKESSSVLLEEGNRKKIYIPYKDLEMEFDNFTDALMLNTAYSIDASNPIYSAFVARKNYIPNVTTEIYEDVEGELKSSSKYNGYHNEVGELNDLVNGEKAESFEYARYWHGYLIFLRPLLLIFNITQLRVILTILLIILALTLAFLLFKKTNIIVSIIFLLSLASVEYFYLGFSLQGIFIFLVAVIASIVLIVRFDKIKNFGLVFFVIGMLTNFLDFLTVPLVTLAVPMCTYFLIFQKQEKDLKLKTEIIEIIKICVLWGIGYGLTWFTKWFLVDILFNKNMISTAIKQVLYRSVGTKEINFAMVLKINIKYIVNELVFSILTVFSFINFRILLCNKTYKLQKNINGIELLKRILPYTIVMIMPFVWYFVLQNHSYHHDFFTYRNLLLAILGINLCIEEISTICLKEKNKKEEI